MGWYHCLWCACVCIVAIALGCESFCLLLLLLHGELFQVKSGLCEEWPGMGLGCMHVLYAAARNDDAVDERDAHTNRHLYE